MLGTQLDSRTISCGGVGGALTDQSICCSPFSSSHCYSSSRKQLVSIRFLDSWKKRIFNCKIKDKFKTTVEVISCKASVGNGERFNLDGEDEDDDDDDDDDDEEDEDDDYVEAAILMSETIDHYHWLIYLYGYQKGEGKWKPSLQLGPFSVQSKDPRSQVDFIGPGFLRGFQIPTIFLKISCDGDFVLPIRVGEHAVEKLIDSYHEDYRGDCPNQFQFTRNLMQQRGYEVKMVKITKRVVNTYFAKIFFHKPGETNTFSIDARPSDAINVARRCKAPIFVNKQIVLADATRILYGRNQTRKKPTYDVTLDSAPDGPNLLSDELNVVRNMNLAAQEERYNDAAMWRDKLTNLRESQ